jgi:hypothetical protein
VPDERDELMAAGRAVLRRPALWPTAVAAGARLLPARWWRGREAAAAAEPWLRFRIETAYGAERGTPTPEDVVTFLRWLREWPPGRG